jgi:hypothetical protein
MKPEITQKGALYSCECERCGATLYTHEWADFDHNERRDAMEAGVLRCGECPRGRADAETFGRLADAHAARLSMSGYLDCTEWLYGSNPDALRAELLEMYGENEE